MDADTIAEAFGLGRAARLSKGPVARGKQGEVWRLGTADGEWAVKIPFSRVIEEEVASSTRFQEAAYVAGVPTPSVCRTHEGRVLLPVEGLQVRVYGWVDVLPSDQGLDPAQVGAAVAAIHSVRLPAPGPVDDWYAEPVGAARWDDVVHRLRAAGAPFAEDLATLRDDLVELESWLEEPSQLQLCHRDLWADNLLPTPDGGVCVLDWENSGAADPAQELGCVLFEFAHRDPARAGALVRSYRDAGGPARIERRGHFTMLIAQLGHITEIAARDWLEPNPRSPERSDAEAWVRETLDDPHTPGVLDALLADARSALIQA